MMLHVVNPGCYLISKKALNLLRKKIFPMVKVKEVDGRLFTCDREGLFFDEVNREEYQIFIDFLEGDYNGDH